MIDTQNVHHIGEHSDKKSSGDAARHHAHAAGEGCAANGGGSDGVQPEGGAHQGIADPYPAGQQQAGDRRTQSGNDIGQHAYPFSPHAHRGGDVGVVTDGVDRHAGGRAVHEAADDEIDNKQDEDRHGEDTGPSHHHFCKAGIDLSAGHR